jgi:hypothetical protein
MLASISKVSQIIELSYVLEFWLYVAYGFVQVNLKTVDKSVGHPVHSFSGVDRAYRDRAVSDSCCRTLAI